MHMLQRALTLVASVQGSIEGMRRLQQHKHKANAQPVEQRQAFDDLHYDNGTLAT